MDTQGQQFPALRWPTPPFFRLAAEPPPGNGRECVLEFVDGRVEDAELVAFEPALDSVGARLKARKGLQPVALAQLRSIKLTQLVVLVPDVAVLNAIGVIEPRAVLLRFPRTRCKVRHEVSGRWNGYGQEIGTER